MIKKEGLLVAIKIEWVKKLDKNLFEIRSKISSNIQRGLYFHDDGSNYVITHGFTKKTDKTTARELNHAKELRNEYFERKENGTL